MFYFRKKITYTLVFCLSLSIMSSVFGMDRNSYNNRCNSCSIVRVYPFLFGLAAGSVIAFMAYTFYKMFSRSIGNQDPLPIPSPPPLPNIEIKKQKESISYTYQTFLDWNRACQELPMYHQVRLDAQDKYSNTALTREEFERAVRDFTHTMQESSFNDNRCWLRNSGPDEILFDISKKSNDTDSAHRAQFFAQKLLLPSDAKIAIHADIHGDLHSLLKYLDDLCQEGYLNQENPFLIEDPNFYMVFLGDYTDRGLYGADILYTLFRLKAANGDKVILLRGNHEDIGINRVFGLADELSAKFGYEWEDIRKVCNVYNFMPAVLYGGTGQRRKDYALFCHGGLEPGFDPQGLLRDEREHLYQWIERLDVSWLDENLKQILADCTRLNIKEPRQIRGAIDIGFIWNDFVVDDGRRPAYRDPRRAFVFGQLTVQDVLSQASSNSHRLQVMFTGHQHSGPMVERMLQNNGLYNSWSNYQWSGREDDQLIVSHGRPVWTLNVSPCSVYGNTYRYNYDTYAILSFDDSYDNWLLEPHNVEVFEQKPHKKK